MPAFGIDIGISLPAGPDLATWRARVRRVEGSGFDALVVSDHLAGAGFAPLPALAAAATWTTSLRLGTLVLNADVRPPLLLAHESATLALLSDGRFELGIGAGNRAEDHLAAGREFESPSIRVARLAATAQRLRQQWAEDDLTIPLLIGGNGHRLLSIAAQHADVVGFVGVSPTRSGNTVMATHLSRAALDAQVAIVEEASGARRPRRAILLQQVTITEDRRAAAAEVEGWFPGAPMPDLLDSPYLLFGSVAHIIEQLHEIRTRWGITEVAVLGSSLGAMERVLASA